MGGEELELELEPEPAVREPEPEPMRAREEWACVAMACTLQVVMPAKKKKFNTMSIIPSSQDPIDCKSSFYDLPISFLSHLNKMEQQFLFGGLIHDDD